MIDIPDPWRRGDPTTAEHLDQPGRAIGQIASMLSQPERPERANVPRFRLGMIASNGPNGETEADLPDSMYWVNLCVAERAGTNPATDVISPAGRQRRKDTDEDHVVAAQNFGETHSSFVSRTLAAGTPVILFPIWEVGTKPNQQQTLKWAFTAPFGFSPSGTPVTVGSTGETEAADTAGADDVQNSYVQETRLSRIAYNHSGDKKLYGFYRTYHYYAGRLVQITGETRVEIDAPEEC